MEKRIARWTFDEPTFPRSAVALDNPDHVAITIHKRHTLLPARSSTPTGWRIDGRTDNSLGVT